jgi:hypothetical protein
VSRTASLFCLGTGLCGHSVQWGCWVARWVVNSMVSQLSSLGFEAALSAAAGGRIEDRFGIKVSASIPEQTVRLFLHQRSGCELLDRRKGAASVQELVSKKDQQPIRTNSRAFEPHLNFVPAPAFSAAFEHSDVFRKMRVTLDRPFDKAKAHPASLMKSEYGIPGWESVKALFWRERILLTADKQSQVYRYAQMVFLAFVLSTLFVRGRVKTKNNVTVRVNDTASRRPCHTMCMSSFTLDKCWLIVVAVPSECTLCLIDLQRTKSFKLTGGIVCRALPPH